MKNSLKRLWQRILALSEIAQLVLFVATSGIVGTIVFLFSWLRGLLLGILTIPVVRWRIETWAIALALFAVESLFFILLGQLIATRRKTSEPKSAKPFSVVPEASGFGAHNRGPIKGKFFFSMCFWVTNTDNKQANIVKSEMGDCASALTDIKVFAEHDRGIVAQFYTFNPNQAVLVRVCFYTDKTLVRSRADYASDITLTDNYGNTYVHNCKFRYQPQEKRSGETKAESQKPT